MTSTRWLGRLPCRVDLAPGEALDSYLERLAHANDLAPAQLVRLLVAPDGEVVPTTTFLMIKPDPSIVGRVSALGGIEARSLANATLTRFDRGLPLVLDGLDPHRHHSFRRIVAQGWFPPYGSQACPSCVATDGVWRIEWRLPIVAICLRHANFLTTSCAGCGERFRSGRHSALRPIIRTEQVCGNPLGLRNPCQHPISAHAPLPAPSAVLPVARTVLDAISGQSVAIMSHNVPAQQYLAELRNLASLLLHLAARPESQVFGDWMTELRKEARERATQHRGPRWAFSPPRSAIVRGQVLGHANEILRQANIGSAAERFKPWLKAIADERNGRRGWLVNRTTRTPTIESLIDAALIERHHVGRRLDHLSDFGTLPAKAIPQVIDVDTYHAYFSGMLGGYECTGRLYVALCIVRSVTASTTWSDTAVHLGLSPALAERTARAASSRMRSSPAEFADAVRLARRSLNPREDFRGREARVRHLAVHPEDWFDAWRTAQSPSKRVTTFGYAVTWMWCHTASAFLDTSPAWAGKPCGASKNAYRAFSQRLPATAQDLLQALVLQGGDTVNSGGHEARFF